MRGAYMSRVESARFISRVAARARSIQLGRFRAALPADSEVTLRNGQASPRSGSGGTAAPPARRCASRVCRRHPHLIRIWKLGEGPTQVHRAGTLGLTRVSRNSKRNLRGFRKNESFAKFAVLWPRAARKKMGGSNLEEKVADSARKSLILVRFWSDFAK